MGKHPQLYYLVQGKRQNARRLVLKPTGNYKRANSCYSHRFCVLGVETNFIKQMKSTLEAIPCL